MAFAGVSLVVDGKLCDSTSSLVDAGADSGYHLLVVEGYSRAKATTPNGEFIKSRPFLVGGHRWIVEYYPNGYDNDDEEFISIFTGLDAEVEGQEVVRQGVKAQFVLSFIDQPELQVSTIICQRKVIVFSSDDSDPCGHSRFMQKELLERSRHLKNDSLVIRCDVAVIKRDSNTAEQGAGTSTTAPVLIQLPSSDMQSHFDNLLRSMEGADITFEVGGKDFAAHRLVLTARSAVFKAQLCGATNEGATTPNVMKIEEIEADVFRGLLTFIYTDAFPVWPGEMEDNMELEEDEEPEGEDDESDEEPEGEEDKSGEATEREEDESEGDSTMEHGSENEGGVNISKNTVWVLQLLEAADRYDLQKLKSSCEEMLASRFIGMGSVADIIIVAERRGCRCLKEACMDFIKSHTSLHKVFTADCLDQIIRTTSPSGLKELFSKFAAS